MPEGSSLILRLYYLTITILTFILWGMDKLRAKTKQWRIPQRNLLLLSLLGGAYGALAGMIVFRHKVRKPLFWIVVAGSCVIHTLVFAFLI